MQAESAVDDGNLTRREAELLVNTAQTLQDEHNEAHERAHVAHAEKHEAEGHAVRVALDGLMRERTFHADAHEQQHQAHLREHALNNLAIDKAESATDKRFTATNAYREQINDMIRTLASRETVDVLVKDVDRRFEEARKDRERRHEEIRLSLVALQQFDVETKGRGMGQGSVVTYIVTAFGLIATVLAIVVVIANVLTGGTP